MANIYDIPAWASTTTYKKNDIVLYGGLYYYALRDHTSIGGGNFAGDVAQWGGTMTIGSIVKPQFIWKPSYNSPINSEPRVKSIKFGDGYSQDLADGINNILITLELAFEERDVNETRAILHFLEARKGAESFIFIPPPPRAKVKRFKCKQWSDKQNFYNNHTISARFEEVVV